MGEQNSRTLDFASAHPPRRILVVTPFYKPAYAFGGLVRSIPALCESLVDLGCEVAVFTTNANRDGALDVPVGQSLNVDGVHVTFFPAVPGPFLYFSPQLNVACKKHVRDFDLLYVLASWTYPLIPACREALVQGVPFVVTPRTSFMRPTWRGTFIKKFFYHLAIDRSLLNRAAGVHYTSVLEQKESAWLKLRLPQFIVPNPVVAETPSTGASTFRSANGFAADDFIALYFGRVEPRKNIELTVRAIARLAPRHPHLKFAVVGPVEDNYVDVLRGLADSLSISGRVKFLPMQLGPEREQAFRECDCFVLSSMGENFAMSAVEAMLRGTPVLLSDQVGIATDMLSERAGLVAPLDEVKFADALDLLITRSDVREELRSRAKTFARRYTGDTVARLWLREVNRLRIPYTRATQQSVI